MSWFPVDDAFHSHPKGRKAGLEAIGLWAVSGSFCMAYLTDGFVPEWFVKEKPRGTVLAKRLVEAGLWRIGKNADEPGWWFHQWKPECTKKHVLEMREKARLRKAKQRESHQESRVTDGVSPTSCLVPTQPNPTQPINPVVNSGGEVTQVEPSPYCPSHPDGTPKNCHPCGQARLTHKAWIESQQQNELSDRRKARERREFCELCDDAGWVKGSEPVIRCDHQEQAHA